MNVRTIVTLLALMAVALLQGCQFLQPPQPAQSFSGTLHSLHSASGGDPTGWVLEMGMAGMGGGSMSLDVSKVQADAVAMDGKQVTIEGRPAQGNKIIVESIGTTSPTK